MRRFLERVWRLSERVIEKKRSEVANTNILLHKTIKKVGEDIERFKLNTALSALMILTNQLEKEETIKQITYETLLKLLAPFAPYIADELWERQGYKTSIHLEAWPLYDEHEVRDDEISIAVQVNGKVRAVLRVPAGSDKKKIQTQSANLPNVSKWLEGKTPRKVIFVPDRLINFVL